MINTESIVFLRGAWFSQAYSGRRSVRHPVYVGFPKYAPIRSHRKAACASPCATNIATAIKNATGNLGSASDLWYDWLFLRYRKWIGRRSDQSKRKYLHRHQRNSKPKINNLVLILRMKVTQQFSSCCVICPIWRVPKMRKTTTKVVNT